MSASGRRAVTWEIADLSRLDAVRDLALRLGAAHPRIHGLLNNAGALFLERDVTVDGLERTFALNHLQYFALSLLLLDRVVAAAAPGAPARIINVSSRAHTNASLDVDDLQMTHGYAGWRAYANSKLCNVLFTRALARRLEPARVVVHALHPGVVTTRFATNNGGMGRFLRRLMDVVSVDADAGADTPVWLLDQAEAAQSTGDYWVKRRRQAPSRAARDDATGERLWQASATLAGIDADVMIRDAQTPVVPATPSRA
jgi:NAD(P)-dependent dehydrogenase (short-subunit alcohol dehydrogenase family)